MSSKPLIVSPGLKSGTGHSSNLNFETAQPVIQVNKVNSEARTKIQGLLDKKYLQVISQNTMDIGRTNLIQ